VTVGVLVVNFGGPQGPDELVPFLEALFDDVLPLPWGVRAVAAKVIARTRARKVQSAYEGIGWSPIVPTTFAQVAALRAELGADAPPIAAGMLFTRPTVDTAVAELRAAGVDAFVVITMFPHYSFSTVRSALGRADAALKGTAEDRIHRVRSFHDDPAYIEALAATIRAGVAALAGEGPIHLLFSPHGLPESFVRAGDPYPDEVRTSVRLVLEALGWTDPHSVGWQSRVGPQKWLTPSTLDELDRLGAAKTARVLAVPISFTGEHVETLHEIDVELAAHAKAVGVGIFGRAPALGVEPAFVRCLAGLARSGTAALATGR
jgi:ferrochelatase